MLISKAYNGNNHVPPLRRENCRKDYLVVFHVSWLQIQGHFSQHTQQVCQYASAAQDPKGEQLVEEQNHIGHERVMEQGEEENEKGKQGVLDAAVEEEREEVGEGHAGVTVEVAAVAGGDGRGTVAKKDEQDLGAEKEDQALMKEIAGVEDDIQTVAVVAY